MFALIRYSLACLLHGQRYLAPALLFVAVLAVFTVNDHGALVAIYVVCAAALLICGAWLTLTILGGEDPVQRAITITSAGRSWRVLVASISLAVLLCVVLAGVGLVFPLLAGDHVITLAGLVVGVEAELTCAFVGIAIGVLCSRLMIRRPGYSLIAALALVAAVPLIPGLPPINPMLRLMSGEEPVARLVAPAAGYLAIGVALLLASGLVTQYVAVRRD